MLCSIPGYCEVIVVNDPFINKLTIDLLLETLNQEDRDTIVLWYIEGYTLKEIAKIISQKYLPKGTIPLGPRTIGIRINKILIRLRQNAGIKGDLDIVRRRKRQKRRKMVQDELG